MRKMKDSGIDVVGCVPVDWVPKRLKYLCTVQTGNEDTQNADPEGQYPFYVRSPIVERCERYTFDGEGILVAGDGAGAGRIFHHAYGKYAVHQRVYRLSNFKYDSDFMHYYLSNIFPNVMDKGSAQSTVPSMRLPMLMNFLFFLPGRKEAKKIVSFLNSKCAEIDTLIADIQSEIDTLEAYKRSVITEAVTKGLDKNVEMKDSGMPWIGNIPNHWKVPKLKYELKENMKYGASEAGVDYDETLCRYIRITDITSDGKLKEEGKLSLTDAQSRGYILKDKAILFARSGGTVGKSFMYKKEYGKSAFAGYLISAISDDLLMLPEWLYYFANSNAYWEWANRVFTQATIQNIGADKYSNMSISIPPIKEQRRIIAYLDDKSNQINKIVSDKKEQLATLADYKKSLIYEYVTGKKEVS